MKRGTKVGQAYVALTADGAGMNKDIADEFEKVDYEKIGQKYGDDIARGLRERIREVTSKLDSDELPMASLNREAARVDARETVALMFSNGNLDDILERAGKRLGVKMGSSLSKEMREAMLAAMGDAVAAANERGVGSLDLSQMITRMEDAARRAVEARVKQEKLGEEIVRKMREDYEKFWNKALDQREKEEIAYTRFLGAEERKRVREAERAATAAVRAKQKEVRERLRLEADYDKFWNKALDERDGREAKSRVSGNQVNSAKNVNFGAAIGGALGAGSRNNFLNLLGRSIGGVIRLTEKATEAGLSMGKTFIEGFQNAGEEASHFRKIMNAVSLTATRVGGSAVEGLASLVASGPAGLAVLAAAIALLVISTGLVITLISALVSVLSALLAIVIALASTIVSALVGGLLVLGAALGGAAAAAGLLVIAFTSMTDAQKKVFSTSFKPFVDGLKGIGQLVLRDLVPAFETWSKNLQQALVVIAPVAAVAGKAFADFGNILTAALSGPGFKQFAYFLGVYLPSITRNLAVALGGFLNGLVGMFGVLMPYVNQFAGYLANVATRFANWATSAEGKNAIVNFVERALTSLTSLWNFTKAFFGYIGAVLFSTSAQNTGDTIFDGLTKAFEKLKANIDNGKLQQWFNDALNFGRALGEFARGMGKVFSALEDSGILNFVTIFTRGFGRMLALLGPPIEGFLISVRLMGTVWGNVMGFMIQAFSWFINLILTGIRNLLQGLGEAIRYIPGLSGVADTLLGAAATVAEYQGRIAQSSQNFANAMYGLGEAAGNNYVSGLARSLKTPAQVRSSFANANPDIKIGAAPKAAAPKSTAPKPLDLTKLLSIGSTARAASTGGGSGGGGGGAAKAYKNPYTAWAQKYIQDGPSIAAQVGTALKTVNGLVAKAIQGANAANSLVEARNLIGTQVGAIRQQGADLVASALQARSAAAQRLASASSKGEAKKALREFRSAQRDLDLAKKGKARIDRAAKLLNAQNTVNYKNVAKLAAGVKVANATIADYARARELVASKLAVANEKLQAALELRNNYQKSVADSIKAFGGLLTAQARTVNGVEQALTATDITANLEDRLAKIKRFQDNLRSLLALGLSEAAYKQIVDAGVEQGGAYAEALIAGGSGSVAQVNGLISSINSTADAIGVETSNRLYQAGVDAAKGLVDGLTSLSAQLDSAAAKLGATIANAVKRELGIKSPSRVLMALMDDVGDGTVIGLDKQAVKVSDASARLSSLVAVSPELANYAARQGAPATVSGNGGDTRFRDLIVNTPTENPEAVAYEVLNEITGRL
jgi:hypothetical protein